MVDAVSIILSGLMAHGQRLAASANNIANINTTGALPTSISPSSTVYKPLSVSYTALIAGNSGAGVMASVTEDPDGYSAAYDPDSIHANSEGFIAVPNVSLENEIMNIMEARLLFKAGTSVLKTNNEMLGDLLDTIV